MLIWGVWSSGQMEKMRVSKRCMEVCCVHFETSHTLNASGENTN
tara:strand:- start:929 stop:1060 length:132 start_codon:yes stop_codon:yes gene_type:complete